MLSLKHLKLLDNTSSPFPRRSSGQLFAQHHLNPEFVQRLVVLASLIPSFGHLQKDVNGRWLSLAPDPGSLSWADP